MLALGASHKPPVIRHRRKSAMKSRTVLMMDTSQLGAKRTTKAYAKQEKKANLPINEIAVVAPVKALTTTVKFEAPPLAYRKASCARRAVSVESECTTLHIKPDPERSKGHIAGHPYAHKKATGKFHWVNSDHSPKKNFDAHWHLFSFLSDSWDQKSPPRGFAFVAFIRRQRFRVYVCTSKNADETTGQ